jgi:hypothetical protein
MRRRNVCAWHFCEVPTGSEIVFLGGKTNRIELRVAAVHEFVPGTPLGRCGRVSGTRSKHPPSNQQACLAWDG